MEDERPFVLNAEIRNDRFKLFMHRVIARHLDEGMVDAARKVLDQQRGDGIIYYSFVDEWDALLAMPLPQLRRRISARSDDMARLRISSPFRTALFTDYDLRIRMLRMSKRGILLGLARAEARGITRRPEHFSGGNFDGTRTLEL